jgi:hypothetical protein
MGRKKGNLAIPALIGIGAFMVVAAPEKAPEPTCKDAVILGLAKVDKNLYDITDIGPADQQVCAQVFNNKDRTPEALVGLIGSLDQVTVTCEVPETGTLKVSYFNNMATNTGYVAATPNITEVRDCRKEDYV